MSARKLSLLRPLALCASHCDNRLAAPSPCEGEGGPEPSPVAALVAVALSRQGEGDRRRGGGRRRRYNSTQASGADARAVRGEARGAVATQRAGTGEGVRPLRYPG